MRVASVHLFVIGNVRTNADNMLGGNSDDEDLDALRAAALRSLKDGKITEVVPQNKWFAVGGRRGGGIHSPSSPGMSRGRGIRRPYGLIREHPMGGGRQGNQLINRNNLISIIPMNSDTPPNTAFNVSSKRLPVTPDVEKSSVPTKFSRFERSDSEESDEEEVLPPKDEPEESKEPEEADHDVVLMQDEDSLGKLLAEFEEELKEDVPTESVVNTSIVQKKKESLVQTKSSTDKKQSVRSPPRTYSSQPDRSPLRTHSSQPDRSPRTYSSQPDRSPPRMYSATHSRRRSPTPEEKRYFRQIKKFSSGRSRSRSWSRSPPRKRSPLGTVRNRSRSRSPPRKRSPLGIVRNRSRSPPRKRSPLGIVRNRSRSRSPPRKRSPLGIVRNRSRSRSPPRKRSPPRMRSRSRSWSRSPPRKRSPLCSVRTRGRSWSHSPPRKRSPLREMRSRSRSPLRRQSPGWTATSRRKSPLPEKWKKGPLPLGVKSLPAGRFRGEAKHYSPPQESRKRSLSPVVKQNTSPYHKAGSPVASSPKQRRQIVVQRTVDRTSHSPASSPPTETVITSHQTISKKAFKKKHIDKIVLTETQDLPVVNKKVARSKEKLHQLKDVQEDPQLEARRRKFASSVPVQVNSNKVIRLSKEVVKISSSSSTSQSQPSVPESHTTASPMLHKAEMSESAGEGGEDENSLDDLRTQLSKRKAERLHLAGNVHHNVPVRLVRSALHGVVAKTKQVTPAVKERSKKNEAKHSQIGSSSRRVMVVHKISKPDEDVAESSSASSSSKPKSTQLGSKAAQVQKRKVFSQASDSITIQVDPSNESSKQDQPETINKPRKVCLKRSKIQVL